MSSLNVCWLRSARKSKEEEIKQNEQKVALQNDINTKRNAEKSPEVVSRKRSAFVDITNALKDQKKPGQLVKKDAGKKSQKPAGSKERSSHENERPPSRNRNAGLDESVESSVCDEPSIYSSCLEEIRDIVPPTVTVEETQEGNLSSSSSIRLTPPPQELPEGVVDFDAENITDPCAAPLYSMDIFNYYKEREAQFRIKKYLDHQPELSKPMRAVLVDWMVEVQESFELNHETLYLAVKLVDHYLMRHTVSKAALQLIGATSMFIACKFDERCPPLVDDFLYICDDAYSRKEFIMMEISMLKAIDFNIGMPLSYRFLRRYARCGKVTMDILTLARFILESSLTDYDLIEESDSKIAAAALLLALKMRNTDWTPTLTYYSGYKESDLMELLRMLNALISLPPSKLIKSIKTKYSHKVFFEVAKIPPLQL